MKIKLLEINISDYKGIQSLDVTNLSDINSIVGTNKTCKSSFGNSFIWCLFGKDSEGKTNFEIMPLDELNNVIPHKEPSVEIKLDLDGHHKTFKRVMKQKWVKKRGEEKSEFDGSCETNYFVDDVPVKMKDFNDHVNSLCAEDVFRSITLPSYFPSLEWKKKREIITSIVPEIDENEISQRKEFTKLFEKMNGKSIADYRKVVSLEKKGYKDELERIPEGIKATQQFIPEEAENWVQLATDIKEKEDMIVSIDSDITDKSKVLDKHKKKIEGIQQKVSELIASKSTYISEFTKSKREEKGALSNEMDELDESLNKIIRKISNVNSDIAESENDITRNNNRINNLVSQREENRKLHEEYKNSEYKAPENNTCEACGQDVSLSADKIEKLKADFNNRKANYLKKILEDNAPLKAECETLETKNKNIDLSITEAKKEITKLEKEKTTIEGSKSELITKIAGLNLSKCEIDAKESKDYKNIEAEINKLMQPINAPKVDVESENQKKIEINEELKALNSRLSKKTTIEDAHVRIETYTKRGKELAHKIADIEGLEYASELFENAVFDELENRINEKFSNIQFKMFERQNNGGSKPCCTILIDGVPFEAANTAAKVGAGIEIINTLSEYYDIYAPIIIDNRESTVEIPETNCQVFNLIVDKSVKTLTIN